MVLSISGPVVIGVLQIEVNKISSNLDLNMYAGLEAWVHVYIYDSRETS